MNDLVTLIGGQPFTSTLAIAEGTENEHKSVIQLVRTYLNDFDSFGRVGFEIAPFETAVKMLAEQLEVARRVFGRRDG